MNNDEARKDFKKFESGVIKELTEWAKMQDKEKVGGNA